MHRVGHVIYLPVSASIKGCGCICIQWLLSSHTESWACVCIYWFVSRRWSWVAFLAFIKNWGIYLHFFVSRAERVVACVCKYWELVTSYVGSRSDRSTLVHATIWCLHEYSKAAYTHSRTVTVRDFDSCNSLNIHARETSVCIEIFELAVSYSHVAAECRSTQAVAVWCSWAAGALLSLFIKVLELLRKG
jgi:hypothetical protein